MMLLFNFKRSNGDNVQVKGSCISDLSMLYLGESVPSSSISPAEKQRLKEEFLEEQRKAWELLENVAWDMLERNLDKLD
jgi:hypothetical protein